MNVQISGQVPTQEQIILKAGTIVKLGGFPFRLVNDTVVEGHAANLALATGLPNFGPGPQTYGGGGIGG